MGYRRTSSIGIGVYASIGVVGGVCVWQGIRIGLIIAHEEDNIHEGIQSMLHDT